MLKLDKEFTDIYKKYYGDVSPYTVMDKINERALAADYINIMGPLNYLKTAATLGNYTYSDIYTKIITTPGLFTVDLLDDPDELDRTIFETAFSYIYHSDIEALESHLGLRLRPRDIYQELAIEMYNSIEPDVIEKVKEINTEHTYSIQWPNPKSRDEWFFNMCLAVGSYSKCHSRKIGAVLVRDNAVISTGYNGPPRGVPTCDQRWIADKEFKAKYGHHLKDGVETEGVCPRRIIGFPSGQGLEICPAGHAERNALINAARLGIETKGTKLYMSCAVPCTPCMVEIINSGVEEIICSGLKIYDETAKYLLENSDLKIRIYDFLV